MSSDAIEALEMKLAFLERASLELGDEVYRQRKEIEALRASVAALTSRLEAGLTAGTEPAPGDERPPHY